MHHNQPGIRFNTISAFFPELKCGLIHLCYKQRNIVAFSLSPSKRLIVHPWSYFLIQGVSSVDRIVLIAAKTNCFWQLHGYRTDVFVTRALITNQPNYGILSISRIERTAETVKNLTSKVKRLFPTRFDEKVKRLALVGACPNGTWVIGV